jgi:nucleoside-diphosphate-sugar epimerase
MLVVVTGASGHIGVNIVRELLAQGYKVKALIHSSKKALENLDIETFKGDVTDYESLVRVFCGADYVIHTAGYVSINDDLAKRIWVIARQKGISPHVLVNQWLKEKMVSEGDNP